jgi:hypothetical protein
MKRPLHRILGLTGKALAIYIAAEAILWVLAIAGAIGFGIYKATHHH